MCINTYKYCRKCNTSKKLGDFGIETRAKDGRRSTCRICYKIVQDKWELKNKNKRQSRAKEWEKENSEKRKSQNKICAQKNRGKIRKRERDRYNNDEEYRKKKIERACIGVYKRRLIEKRRDDGTLNIKTTRELFDKQCGVCNHCSIDLTGEGILKHLDHIKPISVGGEHSIHNVQRLCSTCNLTKGNRFIG